MALKFHKFLLFFSGLVLFLFSCTAAFAVSERTLAVHGGDNFPPFEFINERGKPDGFNVDIFKALMKELKYDYELKLEEWEKVQEEITERGYRYRDALLAGEGEGGGFQPPDVYRSPQFHYPEGRPL